MNMVHSEPVRVQARDDSRPVRFVWRDRLRGDYALTSSTTSCTAPPYLRQPAGNQDLLPGARSPLSRLPVNHTELPRQQPVLASDVISRGLEGSFLMGSILARWQRIRS